MSANALEPVEHLPHVLPTLANLGKIGLRLSVLALLGTLLFFGLVIGAIALGGLPLG